MSVYKNRLFNMICRHVDWRPYGFKLLYECESVFIRGVLQARRQASLYSCSIYYRHVS
jgi:hypothetical protein